ncbi:MAG: Rieske 2Fe-2S domain-containing protein [Deltaproteobacteria bacterium]|nr:Rieske 2Fe-2S domain-containing protein [Deltaproteobacteria bacterium]
MPPEPSLRALIDDLVGCPSLRPTVAEALAACPPGEVRPAVDSRGLVAAGRTADGRPFVVVDNCPHDGGLLSDGYVEGDRLVCARHNWEFDPRAPGCPRLRGAGPCPSAGA